MSEDELEERLFRAYWRYGKKIINESSSTILINTPSRYVEYIDYKGKSYAVLNCILGVLAVYKLYDDGNFRRVTSPKLLEKLEDEYDEL